ncbi:hypothetical protein [Streptomyces daliensis]
MKKTTARAWATAGAAAAFLAGSVVTAAPAQATAERCRTYLVSVGYPAETDQALRGGCLTGQNNTNIALCTSALELAGVSPFHANIACHLAREA